ncbi:MAG: BspA family leucine-rich repeat surface protein [Balneolales bacterium]
MNNRLRTQHFIASLIAVTVFASIDVLATNAQDAPFITIWQTNHSGVSDDNQIIIPGVGEYTIKWQEVDNPDNAGSDTGSDVHTITFPWSGVYRVSIRGDLKRIHFGMHDEDNEGDARKILEVEQWGDIAWSSLQGAFKGAAFLIKSTGDAPDLSGVTDMSEMFRGVTSFNADIGDWDTGHVTDMSYMFFAAQSFNGDISSWDTGEVTNMSWMFDGTSAFNQDIGGWEIGNVKDMRGTFRGAVSFNQDIGDWNTENITDMNSMFSNAQSFNGNISDWNTGNVEDMSGMFYNAGSFEGEIGNWDTGNVTNMSSMFNNARSFNSDIGGWDTGIVTDMSRMFSNARSFNSDLGSWDTGNVINLSGMFRDGSSFRQDIGGWETGNVTDMSEMFLNARSFNHDIGNWDIGSISSMDSMLVESGLSANTYDKALAGWANQNLQSGVTLGAENLYYCEAGIARQKVIDNFSWVIKDAGIAEGCFTTSINEHDGLPVAYELNQNYPNPFNPTTQIRFSIPEQAHVRLDVYSLLGRKISTLVDENKAAGYYDVNFDATSLTSGLYIYRLQTEMHVETRQMMLIK